MARDSRPILLVEDVGADVITVKRPLKDLAVADAPAHLVNVKEKVKEEVSVESCNRL